MPTVFAVTQRQVSQCVADVGMHPLIVFQFNWMLGHIGAIMAGKIMPAKSKKQQQFMGAELRRKREGKKTRTKMTTAQLKEFAETKRKGLPKKKK